LTISCPKQKSPFAGGITPAPSKNFVSTPDGELETTINLLRIGTEIMIVGITPEINCVTALEIANDSPFKRTMVVQMINGSQKYMADKESYSRMTYEAMNTNFGFGAVEYLQTQLSAALRGK
jgi:hypothetical protein